MMVRREAKAIHEKPNNDAVARIIKAIESESEWELDLFEKLNKDKANNGRSTMLIPVLKNAAGRYRKAHQTLKGQALKDMREEKQRIVRIKGTGQWSLAKQMGVKSLPPLTVVRRIVRGPQGEPVGSVATSPTEVDEIVREAYGKIYAGNKTEQEVALQEYLETTGKYIFDGPEANLPPMSGDHLGLPRRPKNPLQAWTNGHPGTSAF